MGAVLWYYEKRLYGQMGARQTANVSYEDVARKAADEIVGRRQVPPGGQQRPDGAAAGDQLGTAASLDVAAEPEVSEVAEDAVDDEFDDGSGGSLEQADPLAATIDVDGVALPTASLYRRRRSGA